MVRDHRIQTGKFTSLVGANFDSYLNAVSGLTVNGLLVAIDVGQNNFTATGSLILAKSGLNNVIWTLTSGTAIGNVAQSGPYYIVAPLRDPNNNLLSGTAFGQMTTEIPLHGDYRLTGSGLGVGTSGAGVILVYKMG